MTRTGTMLRLGIAIVAGLAVLELVLRVCLAPLTPKVFRDDPTASVLRLAPESVVDVRMFGRAVHVSVDTAGHRSTPGAPASLTARVLHVVGDSQVFGWGIADAETLPTHLQQALGAGWRVVNHGVPGYGPWQYRKVLADVPADEVVVLLLTEENDLWDSFDLGKAGSYCGYMSDGSAARSGLPCALFDARLVQALSSWYAQTPITPTPLGFTHSSTVAASVASERVARWLASERERRRDKLMVSVVPWRGRFSESFRQAYFPTPDNAQDEAYWPDDCGMRKLFATSGDPLSLYLPGDSHVSAAGSRLLGRCVLDGLRRRGIAAL